MKADPKAVAKILRAGIFDARPFVVFLAEENTAGASKDYPVWVGNAVNRAARVLFSQAFDALADNTPPAYSLGFTAGMFTVFQRRMAENFAANGIDRVLAECEATEEQMREATRILYGDESATFTGDSLLSDEMQATMQENTDALNSREFEAYSEGFRAAARMVNGRNRSNDATEIYFFMATAWRWIESLKSVEELHEVLTKVFGPNRIGAEVGRTRKICQRIKKRFRKPGRPRKQGRAAK